MNPNAAVQIERDGKFLGSGYVIAPGVILTCLHVVVANPNDRIPRGVTVKVRSSGDIRKIYIPPSDDEGFSDAWQRYENGRRIHGDYWRDAELVWPAADKPPNRYDIAVLSVANHPRFGRLEEFASAKFKIIEQTVDPVACRAWGFPNWLAKEDRDRHLYYDYQVEAKLTVVITDPDYYNFSITSPAPIRLAEWKGISGAAIFDTASGAVIGLVRSVEQSTGNTLSQAQRLPDQRSAKGTIDPSGFWDAIGKRGEIDKNLLQQEPDAALAIVARSTSVTVRKPLDYIHILDRNSQDIVLDSAWQTRSTQGSTKPAVILFHSRSIDDPVGYTTRYGSGDLRFNKLSNGIQSSNSLLRWPHALSARNALNEALDELKRQIADIAMQGSIDVVETAADARLRQTDPPEKFQLYFKSGRIPRILRTIIDAKDLQTHDFELLVNFLEFFSSAASCPEVVSLFIGLLYRPTDDEERLFVDLSANQPPISAAAQRHWESIETKVRQLGERLHFWNVGALTQITTVDLYDWKTQLQMRGVSALDAILMKLDVEVSNKASLPLMRIKEFLAG
jgi:hypothetical protein